MEEQKVPIPPEVREAEHMMSPLEVAMRRARYDVKSHEEDLIVAGITKDQVDNASAKAAERVKLEFEQKEREDPLRRIEHTLEEVAETPEEKLLAQQGVIRLEEFRSGWGEMLKREELRAINSGQPVNIKDVVGRARWHNTTPTFVDARIYGSGRTLEDFPSVNILQPLITDEGKTRIEPSHGFMERVLRKMGVLQEDQTLDILRLLPARHPDTQGYRGPIYQWTINTEVARRIPTNLNGVDVAVGFQWPEIVASVDLPTLQKVVSFPRA